MCGENAAISASGLAFPGGQSGPFLIAGCPTARSIYLVAWEGIHSARRNKSNLSKRHPTPQSGIEESRATGVAQNGWGGTVARQGGRPKGREGIGRTGEAGDAINDGSSLTQILQLNLRTPLSLPSSHVVCELRVPN